MRAAAADLQPAPFLSFLIFSALIFAAAAISDFRH